MPAGSIIWQASSNFFHAFLNKKARGNNSEAAGSLPYHNHGLEGTAQEHCVQVGSRHSASCSYVQSIQALVPPQVSMVQQSQGHKRWLTKAEPDDWLQWHNLCKLLQYSVHPTCETSYLSQEKQLGHYVPLTLEQTAVA
eukprot:scaffold77012_cov21-Tisochrysis_lutea.AAC.1